jgi:hypothetical protein
LIPLQNDDGGRTQNELLALRRIGRVHGTRAPKGDGEQ